MTEKPTYEDLEKKIRKLEQSVADQKKMEAALKKSEQGLESIFRAAPTGIGVVCDRNIKQVNERLCEITGYSRNELVGQNARIFYPTDEEYEYVGKEKYAQISKKGTGTVETKFKRKDGKIIDILLSSTPMDLDNLSKGVTFTALDITYLKTKELELLESEEKYRRLTENAKDMIYRMSLPDGRYEYVSPASNDLFGYPPEKFYEAPAFIRKLIHPNWIGYFEEQWGNLLKGNLPPFYEYQIIHKSGEQKWMNQRNVLISDDNGHPKAIEGIVTDITQRKKTEEALRVSHERFLTVLNGIDANIYVADMESYEILFVNKNMITVFGRDMTGELCWEAFREESEPCKHCTNDQLIDKSGNPSGGCTWQNKNPITGKWYINNDRAIEWSDGRVVRLQISTDITSLKHMEEELRQAQKMESIGTLTGGVAHDFNNILGIILGNTELALQDVPEWDPAHSNLEEIKKATLRASNIVRQLLSFSRKTDQKLQPMEIVMVIEDALKFLRSTIPATIKIEQDIHITDETILADPTQINQIIMNLCINASHAMEQTGGNLRIKVEKISLDDDSAKEYPGLKTGKHVKLTVSDTGPGIDPDIMDRIFDPYFTTKEVGKGSGMGLAVVHGIVKTHGGTISVDSKPGKGTTFSILFPIITGKSGKEAKITGELPRGTEAVLFVDDEESIADTTQKLLSRLGYRVEASLNPKEALEVFRSKPDYFDLVITDMTMPQMTGAKLSEKLMEIRPEIPIIICTGHSALIDEERARQLGIARLVMKPASMSEIAKTIRNVLDK